MDLFLSLPSLSSLFLALLSLVSLLSLFYSLSLSLLLSPRYLSGRVFVLNLLPGSQAQVDRCIHLGDIIDEINGISLRNARNGQVR